MAMSLRVARGDRRVPFANPNLDRETRQARDESQLGPDETMVGGANDQAATIEIDPSEFANNPYLGGGDDEDDDKWSLPEGDKGKAGETEQRREEPQRRQEPEADREQQEEDEEDVRLAYDEGASEERRSHRSRRNGARRRAISDRDRVIDELRNQLGETQRLVAGLYGGQFNLSARDIDQRLQFNQTALERADIEMARAVKEADGEAYVLIQRERDKIYNEIFQLRQVKDRLDTQAREFQQGGRVDPRERQPSPEQAQQAERQSADMERMRDVFLDRYTWFDPDGTTADDRFVKRLDRQLVAEGLNAYEAEFWHEMEARLREAGYRPEQQEREQERGGRDMDRRGFNGGGRSEQRRYNGPPTAAVRSTRRPGNSGGNPLSEIEMDMLRDEGLDGNNLSKEDSAKRDRIINKWTRGKAALSGRR